MSRSLARALLLAAACPAAPPGDDGASSEARCGVVLAIGGSDVAGGLMNMGRVWAFVP